MESNADQIISTSAPPAGSSRLSGGRRALRAVQLNNLRVGQKLVLIAVAFSVPLAVQFTLLVRQQQHNIDILRAEQRGLKVVETLAPLAPLLLQHGNAGIQARTGTKSADETRAALSVQVNGVLGELRAVALQNPRLGLQTTLADLDESWSLNGGGNATGDLNDSINAYTNMTANQIGGLYNTLGQNSGLILDPELASFRMSSLLTSALPNLQAQLGALRMRVTAQGSPDQLSSYREQIKTNLSLLSSYAAQTELASGYALQARPALKNTLGAASDAVSSSVSAYQSAVESALQGGTLDRDTLQYLDDLANDTLTATSNMTKVTARALSASLQARATQLNVGRAATLLLIGAVIVLAVALLSVVARSITRPLGRLARAAQALGGGDLNVHVEADGTDEIGVVATSFNDAVKQLREAERRNAGERENAKRLQHNIQEFLDVTMSVAEGDLTKRGRVSEDVLGSVVDAINLALDEIGQALVEVRGVAQQVSARAGEVAGTSGLLTSAAREQAEQAERMQAQTLEFTRVFRTTAEQISETAHAAERTLAASQAGQSVVQETRRGLEGLRSEMQDISGGMTALAARSAEISEIAETITNFASQTTLLALGASLEAAGAGDSGKRFMVVADGVRQLAEDSANAAGRVNAIVQTVQGDITSLAQRVQAGAQGVNSGYEIARRAGELLAEIEALAARSAQVAQGISSVARAQVDEAEGVREAVSFLAENASSAQEQSLRSLHSAERLNELARQLSAQLGRFQLNA